MEDNIMTVCKWPDFDNHKHHEIRFVRIDNEWYAVLKDICEALGLKTFHVAQRIDEDFLLRHKVRTFDPLTKGVGSDMGSIHNRSCGSNIVSTDNRSRGHNEYRSMLLVNEHGIYQCISGSRKVEARKFNRWWPQVLSRLRRGVGLAGFQALELMNEDVQNHIMDQVEKTLKDYDYFSDVFYNDETGQLMMSKTVAGGDVEQVPYDGSYDNLPGFMFMYEDYLSPDMFG